MALFSPDVMQPQPVAEESPAIASDASPYGSAQLLPPNPASFSESLAENPQVDETETLDAAVPFAQPLLLSVVAPFLWGTPPSVAATPLTKQPAAAQYSPHLFSAAASALSSVNGELQSLSVKEGGSEGVFSSTLPRNVLPLLGDSTVSAVPLDAGGPKTGGTPAQIPPHTFGLPSVGEQAHKFALTPGAQSPTSADNAGVRTFALSPAVNAGDQPSIQVPSRDFAPPAHTQSAPLQPDAVSVEQRPGKHSSLFQNEQLTAELVSRGKTREAATHQLLLPTGTESITPNVLGNMPTALPLQPQGLSRSSALETWREVVSQVSDGILATIEQDTHEARLQLAPPELGKLDIQLVMEGEHLHAHIVAESADVGALIQSHLPELKQALQSHHLDLDAVRVDVQTSGGDAGMFSRNSPQEERASRRGKTLSVAPATERDTGMTPSTSSGEHQGRVSVWA